MAEFKFTDASKTASPKSGGGKTGTIIFAVIIAVVVLAIVFNCFTIVQEGFIGVKYQFGRIVEDNLSDGYVLQGAAPLKGIIRVPVMLRQQFQTVDDFLFIIGKPALPESDDALIPRGNSVVSGFGSDKNIALDADAAVACQQIELQALPGAVKPDDGPAAGHFDRSEVHKPQPPFHGGNGDGDL